MRAYFIHDAQSTKIDIIFTDHEDASNAFHRLIEKLEEFHDI